MASRGSWRGGAVGAAVLVLILLASLLLGLSRRGAPPSAPQGAETSSPLPGGSADRSSAGGPPRQAAASIRLGPSEGARATLELYCFADADVRFRHHPLGVLLEGEALPRGSGAAEGVTDGEGRLQITLPPGTYTLTPTLGERSLVFMGEGETSPLDWPRSGSGWGADAPPSLPSLTLTLGPDEVTTRYAYDSDGAGPLTNALEVRLFDAEGAPVAGVVEVYALDDLRPRPRRGVVFGAQPESPPPPIAHPGLLRPRTEGLADTEGKLSLRVSPGRRRVVARAGYRLGRLDLELDELREEPFRARLTLSERIERGGVRVRLRGAAGGPPPSGRYRLRPSEPVPYATHEAGPSALALHDLPPGPTKLVVERDGARVGELSVEVEAGVTQERSLALP